MGGYGRLGCLMFAVRRAASGGGMVPAPVPTFTYGGTTSGTTSFTISNYNSNLAYTVTRSTGSGTPSLNTSTGVITVTGLTQTANSGTSTPTAGGDFTLSVTSSSAKGGFTSNSNQPSRRLYTYYPYSYHYNIGPCPVAHPTGTIQYDNCHVQGHAHAKNGTPSGYTDSGSDWYRI